ncbi:MAG TPA: ATP-binding cassette domain-containing protein [Solirubrobacteraceae bacterium]|jgi:ABC-2 type transport system ATP-binding protein|nr:ATP-binding cassette domain-containing protein [Solirubrobacteraceae bacterium]
MSEQPWHDRIVEVSDLRKTYAGGVEAVRGLDFEIAAGEVFGLLGPNGAGKTTTVGMLSTTIAPSGGTARLAGFDVATQPIEARSVSSVVFQDAVVDRSLSGRANLILHARLWAVAPREARERIADLVDVLGLAELVERNVGSYSGGERRRLEIARALISRPRVLFLDEPTVGLDPRIRHELLDLLADVREREETTILLTTHYLDEAQRLCDRVAIINRGRIVALATPDALLAGLGREILELRVGGEASVARAALESEGLPVDAAFAVGSTLMVPLRDISAGDVMAALDRAGVTAAAISSRQPNLDDVYLLLTGDRLDIAA